MILFYFLYCIHSYIHFQSSSLCRADYKRIKEKLKDISEKQEMLDKYLNRRTVQNDDWMSLASSAAFSSKSMKEAAHFNVSNFVIILILRSDYSHNKRDFKNKIIYVYMFP